MDEAQGQGAGNLLTAIQDHWISQGWGLDTLDSFRMEMNDPSGGGGNTGGQGSQTQTPSVGTPDGGLSQEFGSPFLNEVEDAHKAIVEPYLKKWDGNVTKRFQDLHAKYQPYEQLGDVESIQQALYVQQLIDESPDQVLNALAEALGVQVGPAQGLGQNNQGQGNEPEIPEEFEGLSPQFVEKFQQQQEALEAIAQMLLGQQQNSQTQAEDQELDSLLSSLHDKYKEQGDFDDHYVMSKMMAGMDPDKAVQSYHNLVQKALNERGASSPSFPILGGGGSLPQENGKKVTELSGKETRDLVANLLAASKNAQQ